MLEYFNLRLYEYKMLYTNVFETTRAKIVNKKQKLTKILSFFVVPRLYINKIVPM